MSIRAKILLGCLSLTFITIIVGLLARSAEVELGTTAAQIYDQAFMSMSYLRSAQNTLLGVSRDLALPGAVPSDLQQRVAGAVEDLDVAAERAMSSGGHTISTRLRPRIVALGTMIGATPAPELLAYIRSIEAEFDIAVEVYAGDGYRDRRAVDLLVQRTARRTWAAMGASVLAALAITVVLSRAIVPSLHHAVRIATSIAGGRLDNQIHGRGRSETGRLLDALRTMQASISGNMTRIQSLMETQASDHASETSAQEARFEAALNNMSQGLCMFDANGLLQVYNRRFAEMFGEPRVGSAASEALPDVLNASQFAPGAGAREGPTSFTHSFDDGRVIAATHRPMANGGWVATYEDISERRRAEAHLAHMARHDALTGLPNRVLFRERTEQGLAELRAGAGLAVLQLDLDDFKAVNDVLGHPVGDALLLAVASRLLDCTRDSDTVVRLGGDEFAVVQAGATQPTDATALAERLMAALAQPFNVMGHPLTIGASIGIVVTADPHAGADELLMAADLALYRAKAEGRGTYRFFQEEMNARMLHRRLLETDLRRAVDEGQFEVHYQPLMSIPTGEVCGFEALVRWRHPERGLVSPAEFIPVAEEMGLIGRIGAWVLNQACTDALAWPTPVKVAVNLSPVQFRNRALATEVADALARSGLPPQRLDVEITESVLVHDSEAVLSILHQIKSLGVRVSMDDFGTGFSSLSYLHHFPFDKIKIDQSFVRNLADAGNCIAIVRAVIALGRSLGIAVIAEGVETEVQLELLRQEGCGEAQGYLFSPPKPAAAVPAILQRFARPMAA